MNFNLLNFWKNLKQDFNPNRKEKLDEIINEISNNLTNSFLGSSPLSNREIGYCLVEINVLVKERLENRKKTS